MPVTFEPSSSRRSFLRAAVGVGAAAALAPVCGCVPAGRVRLTPTSPGALPFQPTGEPEHVALLSDVHVSGRGRGNMAEYLDEAIAQVLSRPQRPGRVLVAGDCAHLRGKAEDYEAYVRQMRPFEDAGLATHVTLGNHDHRDNFWSALPAAHANASAGIERQAMVVPGVHADWFLLDSLGQTNRGPGVIGDNQLGWLEAELDARPQRPALVVVHHDVDPTGKDRSLSDGARLFDILRPRRNVKAVFFGHTHVYRVVTDPCGIHLVNLPALGYTLWMRSFVGWADCRVYADGAVLDVRPLRRKDRKRAETRKLRWRTGATGLT